jgi:hypothetical protein
MGPLSLQDMTMTLSEIITTVSAADLGMPALRCLSLFELDPDYFAVVRQECAKLRRTERPSEVGNRSHVTHWTRPRGEVLQFSLLNRSGRYDDTSTDHDLCCRDKRFHGSERYPNLATLVSAFPHSINFRLNVLSPGASLSPHKEPVCFRSRSGAIGLRVRLHLPVETNPSAEVLLDDQIYIFEPGRIVLFNQGCVHAAANRGTTERLHLVWDLLLTSTTARILFGDGETPAPVFRTPALEQSLEPAAVVAPRDFVSLALLVDRDDVAEAQIVEPQ